MVRIAADQENEYLVVLSNLDKDIQKITSENKTHSSIIFLLQAPASDLIIC